MYSTLVSFQASQKATVPAFLKTMFNVKAKQRCWVLIYLGNKISSKTYISNPTTQSKDIVTKKIIEKFLKLWKWFKMKGNVSICVIQFNGHTLIFIKSISS